MANNGKQLKTKEQIVGSISDMEKTIADLSAQIMNIKQAVENLPDRDSIGEFMKTAEMIIYRGVK